MEDTGRTPEDVRRLALCATPITFWRSYRPSFGHIAGGRFEKQGEDSFVSRLVAETWVHRSPETSVFSSAPITSAAASEGWSVKLYIIWPFTTWRAMPKLSK